MIVESGKRLHVLLADDDADDHFIFNEAILQTKLPLELSYAEDGQKLLEVLENDVIPDVLFLDINMPNVNGIECLKAIRSKPRFKNLPIIIYTTTDFKPNIDTCFEYGANLFVVKPNSFNDLVKIIEKLCTIEWTTTATTPTLNFFKYQTLG